MTTTANVHTYQNKTMLKSVWSWLTVTLFTIAKTTVNYVSNFIIEHKVTFMSLIAVTTVFERMDRRLAIPAKVLRLLLSGIVLQKDGTIVSSMVECLREGRLDLQSFSDKLIGISNEKAQHKVLYSIIISGSCFSIWLGATIAERKFVELAIFAGILLLIAVSRSISLLLFSLLITYSVTPFLWLRKARCIPNDSINLMFDSTLLLATTCCCVINTPFINEIFASFAKKNQLRADSLFALKQALKGIISIVLVWACEFSPYMLARSLFLTLGVYELYEMVCSDEAHLLIQEKFVEFWKTGPSTLDLNKVFKGLWKIIVKLQPYLKGQDAPSKNVLLCVSFVRVILSATLVLIVSSKCGQMVFTGLCLFCFCISRLEDFYILGSVICGKPVLETLPERFLFCFNVFPSRKQE